MNPIRERVLDDRKGFTAVGEQAALPVEQELAMLRGEVLKLKKRLTQAEAHFRGEKDVDKVKLTDQAIALKRQMAEVKKEADKVKQANDKLLGENQQLKKELKAHESKVHVEKKTVKKDKK